MQPATLQQAPDRRIGAWLACLRALRRPAVLDQAIEGKGQVLFRAFWPLIVSLGLILGTPTTRAEEGVASESQMKAAFLVNFPKYVDWPSSAFAHPNSPVIVAIFGDDKVVEEFCQMIGGRRTINGRRIELKRISTEEEISKECQILYVG